jgi:hypothetical protein
MAPKPSPPTPPSPRRASRHAWLVLCALATTVPAGCKQSEEITSYDADRADAQIDKPKNRVLAAMFFHDDALWTFKLVGPEAKVKELEDIYKKYLQSVRFKKDGDPEWTLPNAGPLWVPDKAEGRFDGFRIGPKDDGVELTVNRVDRDKDVETAVLANVNRWRKQLELSRIDRDDLRQGKFVNEFKPKGDEKFEKFLLADLTGRGSGKTARAGAVPGGGRQRAPGDILRQNEQVTFDTPKGWREIKDAAFSHRAATLEVGEGDAKAEVTIIAMGKAAGSLLANVDRWAHKELGLPEVTERDLNELVKRAVVSGSPAHYVDLTGKAEGVPKRTLVLMVPQKDRTWFIKMMGPPDLVGKQKAAFEEFAKSVKLPGGRR